MTSILDIERLTKRYASGHEALTSIDLTIRRGEIFGLLGPNGAGKTTLISIVCGLVNATSGSVAVDGFDIVRDYRQARAKIGLVPQELLTDAFETVWSTVRFSRGVFGCATDDGHLERVLRELALWDKRDEQVRTLSGGMKRRLLIAKALAHEPELLFLDEPTAGVDVELRRDMWTMIRRLRTEGVTIVLTTHYLEEAEEMADRIGVINEGNLILVEDKATVMHELGRRSLTLTLETPLDGVPAALAGGDVSLSEDGRTLVFGFAADDPASSIADVMRRVLAEGIGFSGLTTKQSSLEDIFVDLVRAKT
ncbi:MAG: ABC transporter ATP-binding protein [Pseudomonadota bacterium]